MPDSTTASAGPDWKATAGWGLLLLGWVASFALVCGSLFFAGRYYGLHPGWAVLAAAAGAYVLHRLSARILALFAELEAAIIKKLVALGYARATAVWVCDGLTAIFQVGAPIGVLVAAATWGAIDQSLAPIAAGLFWGVVGLALCSAQISERARVDDGGQATPWPPYGVPERTTYGDAQLADPRRHAGPMRDVLGGGKGIWFGAMNTGQDASYTGNRHLLTVAPNRTGKGTCAIIPNLLMDQEHSIICVDPKGQNAAVTARARARAGKVFCLNPFGEHTGAPWHLPMHGFNPLSHLDINSPTVAADVASLAQALIVTQSTTQPYFEDSARDLVEVLILHLLATKGGKATLVDMRALLGQPLQAPSNQPSLTATILEMTKSTHPFIRDSAGRFLSSARSIDEIIQSAANQTKFLSDPAIAACMGGSDFTMQDFKNGIATLYVILPERYIDAYFRFFRLIVVAALDALRSRAGGTRALLIMDEFARLGHLTAIENAIGAAAGFNVQLWPFLQDLSQLKSIYGDRWESFVANAGVVQWFTPNDPFTAGLLSQRIGKTTITSIGLNEGTSLNEGGPQRTSSKSVSRSETEVGVDFLSPQDLYHMPPNAQILTLAGLKYPVLCKRESYRDFSGDFEVVRELADPDPYHM